MRLLFVQCGLSGNTTAAVSDRIVGGTNAAENEFPWQVSACRSQGLIYPRQVRDLRSQSSLGLDRSVPSGKVIKFRQAVPSGHKVQKRSLSFKS